MKKLTLKKTRTSRRHQETAEEREQREYEEFLRLKEKFESEEYEDEDYEDEDYEDEEYQDEYEDDEDSEELDEELEDDSADDVDEEEPEEEWTEEELAMFEAAEAYYEEGCDGECDSCEYYDYCPAEEEVDPDSVEVIAGMTKGDIKATAQSGMYLAREGAMAAKELKEAMDDIMGVFDVKTWMK